MTFFPLPAFNDNYIWTYRDPHAQGVWVVDPGDGQVVMNYCQRVGEPLLGILITHKHNDHIGGVAMLRQQFDCPVYGPSNLAADIVTHPLGEGDQVVVGQHKFTVWEIPGHTLEHICYVSQANEHKLLLSGDTLFRGGCGRVFEGTYEQMCQAMSRFLSLADDTEVFGTHEYTLANYRFALAIDPHNPMLIAAQQDAQSSRDTGQPTLPTTIGLERATNPFLRFDRDDIVERAASLISSPVPALPDQRFGVIRRAKDEF
ncbi:hydroxyacylglutathione hydrolase [Maribrevibacterium harenarium]|uniref:Hydroxyacylglutathione hydrolase n=1 Tax=Maribrevibacterium harenarium TaxID=2589817 RepID=A0A501WSE8_9GAMM|nr:hydroxyacylglutathione hydrolase [Maribrevibacterium harenarium]TPE51280.1 hydroxyacylglutathione hydrolase [Maribrevibacterium harenarium]